MTKVADLGRFAYEQTFGDKPTDMFMKARLVIGSRPHLHQFIWTGQDLCLEALHEEERHRATESEREVAGLKADVAAAQEREKSRQALDVARQQSLDSTLDELGRVHAELTELKQASAEQQRATALLGKRRKEIRWRTSISTRKRACRATRSCCPILHSWT